ncbi:MAG: hypothetical protein H6705_15450 [Myxococcales bacterium]|nr:hypothetical protein [Myxococcales bacterium]
MRMRPGTPEVPGPPAEWQIGDRIESIDWFATLTRGGAADPRLHPAAAHLARGRSGPGDQVVPWIELYVDSPGSMPDPVRQLNHSILAGFILVDAATAAGGRVRVVVYSHHFKKRCPTSCRARGRPGGALVLYVGGGTVFPWGELHRSARRWRRAARVVRVIISDADFSYNYQPPEDPPPATKGSPRRAVRHGQVVALSTAAIRRRSTPSARARVQVVPVAGWDALPAIARARSPPRCSPPVSPPRNSGAVL